MKKRRKKLTGRFHLLVLINKLIIKSLVEVVFVVLGGDGKIKGLEEIW